MHTQGSSNHSNSRVGKPQGWGAIGLVFAIWGMHVIGSYLWIRAQENMLLGWDPVGHLARSMVYYDMLTPLSPAAWFQAFALDSFRPPLFHFCTVLMYHLFGVSAQVAVMTTFPFLLLLLLAIYGIGKRIASPLVGVLAAFLMSMFPLTFALTRAFYVDLALTALVSASIYFLLSAEKFRSRANALLLGLTMGLGLLTKWTFPLFLVGPFLYVLASSNLSGKSATRSVSTTSLAARLRSLRVSWPRLLKSALIAAILCLIWGLPNWTAISHQPLGVELWAIWGIVLAIAVYSILSPSTAWSNLAAALGIALLLASLWYVTNIDFWKQVYQRSYGGMGGALLGEQSNAFLYILATLDYVPRHLVRGVLSWPFALLLLFGLGKLLCDRLACSPKTATTAAIESRPSAQKTRNAGPAVSRDAFGVVTLWWAIPLLVFMLSINREARSWLPALPAFALIMALSVAHLSAGRLRSVLLVVIVLFGLAQWAVLSCSKFAGVSEALEIPRTAVGPIGPLAVSEYIRWPDWKWTDHRYNVADDVLDWIAQDARKRQLTAPTVGLLVRISQLQGAAFRYLATAQRMHVELLDIGETEDGLVTYPRLFLCDYLVVKSGDNDFLNPEAAQVVERLSLKPPSSFVQAFELIEKFPLPDDSHLFLYKKVDYGIKADLPEIMNPADRPADARFGDTLRLAGYTLNSPIRAGEPIDLTLFWQVLEAMDTDYYTHLKLLNASYRVWGETQGLGHGPWALTSSWPPGQVIKDTRRLDIYPGTPPGEYRLEIALIDPYRHRELVPAQPESAFIGPIEVGRGDLNIRSLAYQHPLQEILGESFRLLGYDLDREGHPGLALPLVLFWQCQSPTSKDYTVFTHLVDKEGQLRASKDNQPVDGFYPTTKWIAGEVVRDPYDIRLSPDMPPGVYHLVVGMYDAETGERLATAGDPDGQIDLGTVVVSGEASSITTPYTPGQEPGVAR